VYHKLKFLGVLHKCGYAMPVTFSMSICLSALNEQILITFHTASPS